MDNTHNPLDLGTAPEVTSDPGQTTQSLEVAEQNEGEAREQDIQTTPSGTFVMSANARFVIELWLSRLPPHERDLSSLFVPFSPTADHYKDWLGMSQRIARLSLHSLDRYELQFRDIGFKYHSIPYIIRHSTTHPTAPSITITTLRSVGSIFENEKLRDEQPFFKIWFAISHGMQAVLAKVREAQSLSLTSEVREAHEVCEYILCDTESEMARIRSSLRAVSEVIDEIHKRLDPVHYPAADLSLKHSLEGSLFRNWVWGFPEICASSSRTEMAASAMLECGIHRTRSWSLVIEEEL